MGQDLFTAEQFITAIKGSGGIISTIALRVGCSWNTANKYIHEKPTVQKAYDDERETVNDLAVAGARPVALTVSLILEEGLPIADLRRILASVRRAADRAGRRGAGIRRMWNRLSTSSVSSRPRRSAHTTATCPSWASAPSDCWKTT